MQRIATADLMTVRVSRFTADYGAQAIVGTSCPRLSWRVEGGSDWQQAQYELQCNRETVVVAAADSVFVPWPFPPLHSRERCRLRVRVRSQDGRKSTWSRVLEIEASLLLPSDWTALFVAPEPALRHEQPDGVCPFLRQEFHIAQPVRAARLYVTALGVYEPHLNGRVIGDEVLPPNWTSYGSRLRYQTFDVTSQLKAGANVIGAVLADGWYRGRIGAGTSRRDIYGDEVALLAQLEIVLEDGSVQTVVTDTDWQASKGPILTSSIYDGEHHDARLELSGWDSPGYDASAWFGVRPIDHAYTTLVTPSDPPIRRIEQRPAVAVLRSPAGNTILDFGQNLVGRLRLTANGEAGQTIRLRHAEVLDEGELALGPLRSARAEDSYTLRGGGEETWEPRFTYHGFRYAQIDGWPGEFDPEQVVAVVLHSDLERTGWFECSDPLINRLHENAVWSMRGNFVGLPTDCPQRDERLGWTGDVQIFAPAACFLYDVNGILVSWTADLVAEQALDGNVPHVVPNVLDETGIDALELPDWLTDILRSPAAAWGDAAVIVPWTLYQRFGDTGILRERWESMHKWVDHLTQIAGDSRIWDTGAQFGDWLDPQAPPDRPDSGQTPGALVATAYFARSADLVARTAKVLGFDDHARDYGALAREVQAAYRAAFMDDEGNSTTPSATAHALVLVFGLAEDEEQEQRLGQRLRELVAENDYRISTGFVGTPLLCDALCQVGEYEAAYRLLQQTECPSWLYQVKMGATTIWERWDGLLPGGKLNPTERGLSFNHYAFGAVVDWLHRTVAGLAPLAPGYREIGFAPRPGDGLRSAAAELQTPYGQASIAWWLTNQSLEVAVTVPPNSLGHVMLPGEEPVAVGSGHHHFTQGREPRSSQPYPRLT